MKGRRKREGREGRKGGRGRKKWEAGRRESRTEGTGDMGPGRRQGRGCDEAFRCFCRLASGDHPGASRNKNLAARAGWRVWNVVQWGGFTSCLLGRVQAKRGGQGLQGKYCKKGSGKGFAGDVDLGLRVGLVEAVGDSTSCSPHALNSPPLPAATCVKVTSVLGEEGRDISAERRVK